MAVRMYLSGERPPQAHSRAQVQSALANGCSVGAYLWAYSTFDPAVSVRQAIGLARACGVEPPVMWIDAETYNPAGKKVEDPGPDARWLRVAVAECDTLGVRAGIYTGAWWWRGYMGDTGEFGYLPLWAADYNHIADLASVQLFGGWQPDMLWGHQYAADVIDLNVFDPRAIVR